MKLLPEYRPSNIPKMYTTEQEPASEPYPVHLNVGEQRTVGVHSALKWEDSTLYLEKGESYEFEASGCWYDASISTGPEGYPSPNWIFRLLEKMRRSPKANWFALVGAIGRKEAGSFVIGQNASVKVTDDGILHCFANDLPITYWNNSGLVKLTVKRMQ